MKFCEKCGKEIMDEAVICPGCGCAVNRNALKNEHKVSTFRRNRKQWLIVFSVLFIIFSATTIMILTSTDFIKTSDLYKYLHSDLATFGNQYSASSQINWQRRVDATIDKLIPYYIAIGVCGILALTGLVGDVLLITLKSKNK